MLPEVSWMYPGSLPSSWRMGGGVQECSRLPGDNGPLSCWVAAGPQTIGLDQALSCCPWPETDAQEPPVSAPGLTSWAALSLRGRTPERERGKQWGPHARRPVSSTGWGLPGESMAWQVLLLCGGTGAFPGGLPAWRQDRRGAAGPLVRGGPNELILLAPFCPDSPAQPCTGL